MTHNGFKDLLKNGGFHSFLWTQFLGAFNDNVYKIIVSMRAVHIAASTGGSAYLSLAGAVFVIPFLLFSGYSGHLADTISKRKVLISVKVFEIFVMTLGLAVFFTNRVELMLLVLFLMALHSTIFSPAKYGIVPEMLPDKDLSRANGLLEMSTFVAIVLGTSIGTFLFTAWKGEAWKMGAVMLAVAVAGLLTSLKITRVPASGNTAPFKIDPFAEVWTGTKHLLKERPLWLTVLAISYFWFLGALFQMDLLLFGSEVLKVGDLQVGLMITALAVGIGVGSMLAGRLSGNKVELGLVPLGAILMSFFCVALYLSRGSYTMSVISLSLLGVASGLFIVPLNAYLQQRSESHEKGRIIATNNFYNTIGLLLASGALSLFHDYLHFSPDKLLLIFGFVTLAASIYVVSVVPEFLIRFVLWMVTHTIFKIRIVGQENVPFRGAALLVSNHVSHIDGFVINACIQRFIRYMVWKPFYDMPALHWFFQLAKAIPVGGTGPRDVLATIKAARKELEGGHVVVIFAEGAITRTGNLQPFRRGLEKIVEGLDVPVIPVHLDGMWDSMFSFKGGKFSWKRPTKIPYPVTVSFGQPMPSTAQAYEVRQAIAELSSEATGLAKSKNDRLDLCMIRDAKKNWGRFAMADSTGKEVTKGKALIGGLLIAKWLRKNRRNDKMIGLLLPSSVGGALANIGVTMTGKVPVNLNFTAGREAMASAVEQCGTSTILTSKVFLAKAKLDAMDGAVYLEDILASITGFDKLWTAVKAKLLPGRALATLYGASKRTPDSLATVIFSSGSSGVPKGVMLTHHNVISNIRSMLQVYWLNDRDVIVGVLPFFHSFGYTVTLWLPILAGCGAAFHPNPTEANKVGEIVSKHKGTFLLATPTFCATYTRKCSKEEFASLRVVLVGAEKLRESVNNSFQDKFGLGMYEGYGCTEMSPVVGVNTPNYEAGKESQIAHKPGTVGLPLPGIAVKIVDLNTQATLPPNTEGLLLVKGANQMQGYLNQPQRTAEAIRDGWYVTGDIGLLDDDGFIRITDRLARFSKIGGEMVPHLKVEESIYAIVGDHPCAVTGIPDEQRGERLVALYTATDITPGELWKRVSESDLPKLWVPKRENFYHVEALPTLGTGKLDLMGVKAKAQQLAEHVAVSQ